MIVYFSDLDYGPAKLYWVHGSKLFDLETGDIIASSGGFPKYTKTCPCCKKDLEIYYHYGIQPTISAETVCYHCESKAMSLHRDDNLLL